MNCKNCGAPLNEADKFCQNCGMVVDTLAATQNYGLDQTTMATPDTIANIKTNTMENQTPAEPILSGNEILENVGNTSFQTNTQPMNDTLQSPTVNMGMDNNQMYQAPVQNYSQTTNQVPLGQPTNNNSFTDFNMNNNSNRKNNNMIIILMGAVIVVLLIIVIFLALNTNKANTTQKNQEQQTPTTQPTNTENTNTTTVVLDKYTLSIPNEYTQETQGSGMTLYTDTKAMYLEVLEGNTLNQIDMELTKANIEASGYTVIESAKKQYNGVNMAVFGIEMSGQKQLIAYAELPNKAILCADIMNISGQLDYTILENDFAPVVKSAKYQATSNSIATGDTNKQMKKFIEGKK